MGENDNVSKAKKGISDDLRQIGVVTKYEILTHVRSRKMLVFVAVAVLLLALITLLSYVLDGGLPDNSKELLEQYISWVSLFMIIGVSLFCASTIASEFEERTALLMFPRPIKKTSFFLGKVLACYILCGAIVVLYYLVIMILSILNTGDLDANIFGSLGMAVMFMVGAGGFALLMSSIFKRGATAIIITIVVLLMVFSIVDQMLSLFGVEPVFSVTYAAKDIINYVAQNPLVTDIDLSDYGTDFRFKDYNPTHTMAFSIMAIWAVVTTAISAFLFKRKEF
ncbi:MAG: ABC transporter permease [Methanomassiliicoccaceae archaeon]|jgi:ABC-2 type transport system permease protein|nr:ABC transporter permease [Methanomassiliicoccaceae archaeon]